MRFHPFAALPLLALAGCNGAGEGLEPGNANVAASQQPGQRDTQLVASEPSQQRPFQVEELGRFSQPWAMAFIPGSDRALITERGGRLLMWTRQGAAQAVTEVAGVPRVDHGGQGGLGDVAFHPDFANNRLVYLSWAEAGDGDTRGAAVGRARLSADGTPPRLENLQVIWRQQPKVDGRGHFAHRLAFSPDGRHLFITSGDRQKMQPAQDTSNTIGTIVRLNADGSVPADNPYAAQGGAAAQIWSHGHRNQLGIAFDASGNLWSHEMGPRHGDEFNLILPGRNYGWPVVSYGVHYDGARIPDHPTRTEFEAPRIAWVPAISPAGMMIYRGSLFPQWRNSAFLGGLSGQSLVRVALDGTNARVADSWAMGARIREVTEGPDGAIYVLEDERGDSRGRLLRLTPQP